MSLFGRRARHAIPVLAISDMRSIKVWDVDILYHKDSFVLEWVGARYSQGPFTPTEARSVSLANHSSQGGWNKYSVNKLELGGSQ